MAELPLSDSIGSVPPRRGDFGRLGQGDCNDVFIPRSVSCLEGKEVTSVACGDTHTLVVLASGALLAFGRNQNGQLGNGTNTDCEAVCGASCGAEHSVCVTRSGRVYAWGWGRYGNLGTGERTDQCAAPALAWVGFHWPGASRHNSAEPHLQRDYGPRLCLLRQADLTRRLDAQPRLCC
jgi:Regulator of chromosome condensation (RCC1) repeat